MTALWFLLGALVISAIGSAVIVLYHRKPTTEDWSVEEFRKEMHALSPEAQRRRARQASAARRPVPRTVRPVRPAPPEPPVPQSEIRGP